MAGEREGEWGKERRGEEGEGKGKGGSLTPLVLLCQFPHWSDDRYNSQQTAHNPCHRLHGFICTFIGHLVSNIIIAYALMRGLFAKVIDTSVDFATVQK